MRRSSRRNVALLGAVCLVLALLVATSGVQAAGIISSLSVNPSIVNGGASAQGTVSLAGPDAGDTLVQVFSSDTSAATVPASVTVPAGATSATFTIATNAAAPPTSVTITAWVSNTPRSANLSVNPATPAGPSLTAVSVTPSTLSGGSGATGTVTFSGATNGASVQLASSNPAVVQVPQEAVVNGGASTGAFPVSTSPVGTQTTVTITATWFSVTRTATITVTPGAPAAADTVAIKRAEWKAGLLTIEATSTNANAILGVYTSSGGFMFNLTNKGGGRYFDQRGWVINPVRVIVRSNLGGSETAVLKT